MLQSPKKVIRTATVHSGIPKEMSEDQKLEIEAMVDEWTSAHKGEAFPPPLADLAARAGFATTETASTPARRGKKDNLVDTPSARDGAIADSLKGLRFVLSGTWPDLGGSQGLTLGKLRLKSRIKKFGGAVTGSYSRLTNGLVVGNNPGHKKITDAHERKLKIIDIAQLTSIIVGELTMADLTEADYPEVVIMVLEAKNIQVQRHPHSSNPEPQAADGTAPGLRNDEGDGHSNG
jgi:hypothetical protein